RRAEAMAATFVLEVATPERLVLRLPVNEAQIPAANGYLGVLPLHSPLLSEMGIGELTYTVDGTTKSLSVAGGWVEVLPDHVRVLADRAENADEIDVARAQRSLQRAEGRLNQPGGEIDMGRALNAMKRAEARLAASKRK
ncbi:MAG: F0F1 ATP synthase subunit epsilon, partial [Acidobacteria bacterium]|nr:F0F1 ATP synthase subunit epsilon [Acidobacteriota bacterium]